MKNNDKHTHHHLSKFYLKYWANSANKVWVYELNLSDKNRRPNPNLLHIDKVCSDYHLFSIGNDNVSIENWADKNIETHCGETFKKIKAMEKIDENDIFYTKAFLALTMARHPVHAKSSEIILKYSAKKLEPLNPLAQTVRLRMEVNLIELDQLNLQILYIPNDINASFITSDIPFAISWNLIKEKTLGENELILVHEALRAAGDSRAKEEILGENEITRRTFERVWFPISPKTLGFLSKTKTSSRYEKIPAVARVTNINSGLLSFAKDILIANDPNIFKSLPKIRKLTE